MFEIKRVDGIPCIILPEEILIIAKKQETSNNQLEKKKDFTSIQREKEKKFYKSLMRDLIEKFQNK